MGRDDGVVRCAWADGSAELTAYHDDEWGVPSRDERHLFELLTLEGAQAGLSWLTILRKRDGYRRAFAGFDPEVVARFADADVERLLGEQASSATARRSDPRSPTRGRSSPCTRLGRR